MLFINNVYCFISCGGGVSCCLNLGFGQPKSIILYVLELIILLALIILLLRQNIWSNTLAILLYSTIVFVHINTVIYDAFIFHNKFYPVHIVYGLYLLGFFYTIVRYIKIKIGSDNM